MISNAMTILSIWTTMICNRDGHKAGLSVPRNFLSRGLVCFSFFYSVPFKLKLGKTYTFGNCQNSYCYNNLIKIFISYFFQRSLTLSTVIQQLISSAAFQIKNFWYTHKYYSRRHFDFFFLPPGSARGVTLRPFDSESKTTSGCSYNLFSKKITSNTLFSFYQSKIDCKNLNIIFSITVTLKSKYFSWHSTRLNSFPK